MTCALDSPRRDILLWCDFHARPRHACEAEHLRARLASLERENARLREALRAHTQCCGFHHAGMFVTDGDNWILRALVPPAAAANGEGE